MPLDAKIGTETEAYQCCCKTGSGQFIPDHDGWSVQGTIERGYGESPRDRQADVHKTLVSASKVHSEDHVAVVDSNGGYITFYNGTLARKIQQFVQK